MLLGVQGSASWVILDVVVDVFCFPLWPMLQYLELLWLQVKKMRENEWKVRGLVAWVLCSSRLDESIVKCGRGKQRQGV